MILQTFDELLELAEQGDHREVDMLVKDIYGGAYSSIGLSGDIIASSFGKAARSPKKSGVRQKFMLLWNIQIIFIKIHVKKRLVEIRQDVLFIYSIRGNTLFLSFNL